MRKFVDDALNEDGYLPSYCVDQITDLDEDGEDVDEHAELSGSDGDMGLHNGCWVTFQGPGPTVFGRDVAACPTREAAEAARRLLSGEALAGLVRR